MLHHVYCALVLVDPVLQYLHKVFVLSVLIANSCHVCGCCLQLVCRYINQHLRLFEMSIVIQIRSQLTWEVTFSPVLNWAKIWGIYWTKK